MRSSSSSPDAAIEATPPRSAIALPRTAAARQAPPHRRPKHEIPPAAQHEIQGSPDLADLAIVDSRRSCGVASGPAPRNSTARARPAEKWNENFFDWGSAPDPEIFKGIALAFDDPKQLCPGPNERTGASTERHRRAIDLVIPCRVASPQSPTPFHQTPTLCTTKNRQTRLGGTRQTTRWGSVIVAEGKK